MQHIPDDFSAFRIFKSVQKFIEETNTAPLTSDIVKVNKDQLNDLDGEYGNGFPFARIDMGFPESDTQLIFMMDFFEAGVGVGISANDGVWIPYVQLGKDAEAVAEFLKSFLTALSNGQMKVLLTSLEDHDHVQAIEVIYRAPDSTGYEALSTSEMFLAKKHLKHHSFKTIVLANDADIEKVSLDVKLAQKLVVSPDVDAEIVYEIGRKKIRDLSEPLTPELLKQNIDAYSEKIGEKAVIKVTKKLENFEQKVGIANMSPWQAVVKYAKWRHLELLLYSFMMLIAVHLATWTPQEIGSTAVIFGILLISLFFSRNLYPYPQVLYVLAPLAYGVFAISTVMFIGEFFSHWVMWTVAVLAAVSLLENLFFDGYFIRRRLMDKIVAWAKR